MRVVSSRAPVWGASPISFPGWLILLFQVVPPCGGHPGRVSLWNDIVKVSSRAPVWGASQRHSKFALSSRVSSRAPVWGASRNHTKHFLHQKVSSRAPVWGASGKSACFGRTCCSFKSCPRVGGICSGSAKTEKLKVSSRAPVWGASAWLLPIRPPDFGFKSCPRVGGICSSSSPRWAIIKFQVVPPCGGHPGAHRPVPAALCEFQVVPPCGGHQGINRIRHSTFGFQVVPPCGGHPK